MKNSAGILFNENTELIVEADPDGTVTSCRNLKNNTEYVGGGSSDFSTAEVTLADASDVYDTYDWGNDPGIPVPYIDIVSNKLLSCCCPTAVNEKINVPLYKGHLLIVSPSLAGSTLYNIVDGSGNLTVEYLDASDPDAGVLSIDITGDCTLYLGYSK